MVKGYKLIYAGNVQSFSIADSQFMELRTLDICNAEKFGELDDVSSFINVYQASQVTFERNHYSQVTLGKNRILHRFTNVNAIEISESIYDNVVFFDESRLALF